MELPLCRVLDRLIILNRHGEVLDDVPSGSAEEFSSMLSCELSVFVVPGAHGENHYFAAKYIADIFVMISSRLPVLSLLEDSLCLLAKICAVGYQVEPFIRHLIFELPLPPIADTLNTLWDFPGMDQPLKLAVSTPRSRTLPFVDDKSVMLLFDVFDVESLVDVFDHLLCERNLVLVSTKRCEALVRVAEALRSLLYPLCWSGLFLPVVDTDQARLLLRNGVLSCTPFLLGIMDESFVQTLASHGPGIGSLIADLDTGNLHRIGCSGCMLPPLIRTRLVRHLVDTIPGAETDDSSNMAACGFGRSISGASLSSLDDASSASSSVSSLSTASSISAIPWSQYAYLDCARISFLEVLITLMHAYRQFLFTWSAPSTPRPPGVTASPQVAPSFGLDAEAFIAAAPPAHRSCVACLVCTRMFGDFVCRLPSSDRNTFDALAGTWLSVLPTPKKGKKTPLQRRIHALLSRMGYSGAAAESVVLRLEKLPEPELVGLFSSMDNLRDVLKQTGVPKRLSPEEEGALLGSTASNHRTAKLRALLVRGPDRPPMVSVVHCDQASYSHSEQGNFPLPLRRELIEGDAAPKSGRLPLWDGEGAKHVLLAHSSRLTRAALTMALSLRMEGRDLNACFVRCFRSLHFTTPLGTSGRLFAFAQTQLASSSPTVPPRHGEASGAPTSAPEASLSLSCAMRFSSEHSRTRIQDANALLACLLGNSAFARPSAQDASGRDQGMCSKIQRGFDSPSPEDARNGGAFATAGHVRAVYASDRDEELLLEKSPEDRDARSYSESSEGSTLVSIGSGNDAHNESQADDAKPFPSCGSSCAENNSSPLSGDGDTTGQRCALAEEREDFDISSITPVYVTRHGAVSGVVAPRRSHRQINGKRSLSRRKGSSISNSSNPAAETQNVGVRASGQIAIDVESEPQLAVVIKSPRPVHAGSGVQGPTRRVTPPICPQNRPFSPPLGLGPPSELSRLARQSFSAPPDTFVLPEDSSVAGNDVAELLPRHGTPELLRRCSSSATKGLAVRSSSERVELSLGEQLRLQKAQSARILGASHSKKSHGVTPTFEDGGHNRRRRTGSRSTLKAVLTL